MLYGLKMLHTFWTQKTFRLFLQKFIRLNCRQQCQAQLVCCLMTFESTFILWTSHLPVIICHSVHGMYSAWASSMAYISSSPAHCFTRFIPYIKSLMPYNDMYYKQQAVTKQAVGPFALLSVCNCNHFSTSLVA